MVQYCADPEASRDWYQRFFGVESTAYGDAPYFHFGEHSYLILAPGAPGTGRGGSGVWFEVESGVWFEVEDVEAAYQERLARGFTFNEEPFDISPGRLVTALDPDGNIVGLIDNTKGGMPGLEYD